MKILPAENKTKKAAGIACAYNNVSLGIISNIFNILMKLQLRATGMCRLEQICPGNHQNRRWSANFCTKK